MRIGIVGTGRIAAALVTGFCSSDEPPKSIVVSPRNAAVAKALADRFGQVSIASDNQAVLDASDWVVLSLLPPMAREVLSGLRFRAEHRVVSVMAMVGLAALRDLVAPARPVRALTLPSVSQRTGPVALCPGDADTERFLARLGTPLPVADERNVDVLWAMTAMIAPFYALVQRTGAWGAQQGVEPAVAQHYAAGFYRAVAGPLEGVEDVAALIAEAQTPGGLNEQALRTLNDAAWFGEVDPVLDAILSRFPHS